MGDSPEYTVTSAALTQYRSRSRDGLAELSPEDRQSYGNAVSAAILAKQRSELLGAVPPERRCSCASGTSHNDGESIHKAIRRKQAADLAAWPGKVRRARRPHEWASLYQQAMEAKRNGAL